MIEFFFFLPKFNASLNEVIWWCFQEVLLKFSFCFAAKSLPGISKTKCCWSWYVKTNEINNKNWDFKNENQVEIENVTYLYSLYSWKFFFFISKVNWILFSCKAKEIFIFLVYISSAPAFRRNEINHFFFSSNFFWKQHYTKNTLFGNCETLIRVEKWKLHPQILFMSYVILDK